MRTDLWSQFGTLLQVGPRLLATVTAHNPDGTSSVTSYDGAEFRVLGQAGPQDGIPYNVWVQDGRVLEVAPNLPLVQLTV